MLTSLAAVLGVLLWPALAGVFLGMFHREIRDILKEIPPLMKRLLSLKALGAELQVESLGKELNDAEQASKELALPVQTAAPLPPQEDKHGK